MRTSVMRESMKTACLCVYSVSLVYLSIAPRHVRLASEHIEVRRRIHT
jgi:hypothetical protein